MRILSSLRNLILGVWVGSLVCAGLLVAPVVFKVLSSRTQAGLVFGEVLGRLNKLEMVCAVLLVSLRVILIFWKNFKKKNLTSAKLHNAEKSGAKPRRFLPSDGILLLMSVLLFYYAVEITPEMTALRSKISSFDMPVATEVEAKQRFDTLHHRYSKAMSANLLLGVMMFFFP